jgi:polar amino acid transport system substrate-binding protein
VTRVGLSELGYAAFQQDRQARGVNVDTMTELSRRTGCRFSFDWYPRGRLFAQFASGKVDLTASALRTPERDRSGSWIAFGYTRFELLLTRRSAGDFHSLAEFVDHSTARLNATRGIAYAPAVMEQLARLERADRLEYVNDYDVVFKKIVAGRADGTLSPPMIHLRHLRRLGLDDDMVAIEVAEAPRALTGVYLSKANLSEAVRQHYTAVLRAMVADGTVQKIYERYLGAETTRRTFEGGVREILDAMPR